MALDQVLLESTGCWLRLTRWDRPCVTLGRFQQWPQQWPEHSPEASTEFPRIHPFDGAAASANQEGLPAVRRITGGGSILHGEDLTIAISAPCPSPIFPDRSPAKVATQISELLCEHLNPEVSTRGGEDREKEMLTVVDCFQRRSPSDIVIERDGRTVKAGGLALAFQPGRVLIEGSLLRQPTSRPIHQDQEWFRGVAQSWLAPFGATIPDEWDHFESLAATAAGTELNLESRMQERVSDRFATTSWNRR